MREREGDRREKERKGARRSEKEREGERREGKRSAQRWSEKKRSRRRRSKKRKRTAVEEEDEQEHKPGAPLPQTSPPPPPFPSAPPNRSPFAPAPPLLRTQNKVSGECWAKMWSWLQQQKQKAGAAEAAGKHRRGEAWEDAFIKF